MLNVSKKLIILQSLYIIDVYVKDVFNLRGPMGNTAAAILSDAMFHRLDVYFIELDVQPQAEL